MCVMSGGLVKKVNDRDVEGGGDAQGLYIEIDQRGPPSRRTQRQGRVN